MWDKRFSDEEYAYGEEPNEFLRSQVEKIPVGNVLCIGEGEGRNAVFLARSGRNITAVDFSVQALRKTEKLAQKNNVEVTSLHADLSEFHFQPNYWQGIVSVFCHLPEPIRKIVHERCVGSLQKGGVFLLEAYSKKQLQYNTGGPKNIDLLMDVDQIKQELEGLEFITAQEIVRNVFEGQLHFGPGSVVQILAVKN